MIGRQAPIGTAGIDVLLKLTSARYGPDWSRANGSVLYESKAMTDAICQRLVRHGLLEEHLSGLNVTYSVTAAGKRMAQEIRASKAYG